MSLFPEKHIDLNKIIMDKKLSKNKIENFLNFIDGNINELDILAYIKKNKLYFIIASILKENYDFGY